MPTLLLLPKITEMKLRNQLNEAHYQQAVKFAESLSEPHRQEFLAETAERHQFEQSALAKIAQNELQNSDKKLPLVKVGAIIGAILLVSVAVYWQSGRYEIVQKGEQLHQAFQTQVENENNEQKNDRYIRGLQNHLRENPNNGEMWFELGQAYALSNDFRSALICYENAHKVLGDKAAIFGAMATADYYDNKQKLSAQAKGWIEKALSLDNKESSSLLLLASDAFLNNDYQTALNYWRKVLDSENESIDRRAIIQSMEMARQMLKGNNGRK